MKGLFGTDGVRGRANDLLTPELVVALARATARTMLPKGGTAIIGRDTRVSGPMLESALAAGLAAEGIDVRLAGIIPTPAISFLIKDEGADLGIVVSASHNPPEDNGIKLFNRHGMKLSEVVERAIERAMETIGPGSQRRIGSLSEVDAAATRYGAFLSGILEVDHVDFSGMRLVLDCAYGATARIAPRVFRHLGATVIPIHATCDGEKINVQCGATDLTQLEQATRAHDADLGIAFDGDGDRVLLVDSAGFVIDGDRMMGIAATSLASSGRLHPPAIVATVLSNRGLELWLAEHGISVHRTAVGDRHVSHQMVAEGIQIGGEASGHIIFRDDSPTGDGILTAVKLLGMARQQGTDLPTLARRIPLFPQCARNIRCARPDVLARAEATQQRLQDAETDLGASGRVVLRPSGTQPYLRIMVESEDPARCAATADELERALVEIAQAVVETG